MSTSIRKLEDHARFDGKLALFLVLFAAFDWGLYVYLPQGMPRLVLGLMFGFTMLLTLCAIIVGFQAALMNVLIRFRPPTP